MDHSNDISIPDLLKVEGEEVKRMDQRAEKKKIRQKEQKDSAEEQKRR